MTTYPTLALLNKQVPYRTESEDARLAADPRAQHAPVAWIIHSSDGPRYWPVGKLSVNCVGVLYATKYSRGITMSFDNAIDAMAWLLKDADKVARRS